jgi:hypothetical protein
MNSYEFHPIANLFPLMEDKELEELAFDIQIHGLLQPIVKYQGKILDGRNRYLACGSVSVEPKFIEYLESDPAGFVTSMNIERRHLTPSQRACVGVELLPFYKNAMKEKEHTRKTGGTVELIPQSKSRDFVAEKVHVNPHYITDAAMLKEKSPELFEEMKSGLIHMKEALHEVHKKERKEERERIAEKGKSIKPDERWNVWKADITTWKAPRQYDFIITDPPYPKEYLPLYETLARRANEWLKPGGLLIAMCGQSYINQIYSIMDKYLKYYWNAAYLTPGQSASIWNKQVIPKWKPLLIYSIGEYSGKMFGDVFESGANEKDFHKWGQSVSGMLSIIKQICLPGQSILDPFCGAGTTGIAALDYGCLFDGIDIEMKNVNISRARLNDRAKA